MGKILLKTPQFISVDTEATPEKKRNSLKSQRLPTYTFRLGVATVSWQREKSRRMDKLTSFSLRSWADDVWHCSSLHLLHRHSSSSIVPTPSKTLSFSPFFFLIHLLFPHSFTFSIIALPPSPLSFFSYIPLFFFPSLHFFRRSSILSFISLPLASLSPFLPPLQHTMTGCSAGRCSLFTFACFVQIPSQPSLFNKLS